MTTLQKAIKYFALAFAVFLAVSIIVGVCGFLMIIGNVFSDDAVTQDVKTYSVSSDVHSLEINISAANFTVSQAEEFAVKSNLKNISVEEKNGTLFITEGKKLSRFYDKAVVTLYIPNETVFEKVSITTGAGKFSVDSLSTERLVFYVGAGDVNIKSLTVTSNADIEGGAGRITVDDGAIKNLDLEMGAGQLKLTSALTGETELDLGVGASNINIKGNKDDYRLDVEKGLGSISVDGESFSNTDSYGSGQHIIDISGGVGAVSLNFKTEKSF